MKAIPVILAKFLSSGGLVPSQEPSSKSVASNSSCSQTDEENPEISNRGERFYATEEDVELSSELLDLTTKAFTIVRWLNDRIVTRVIKAWNLAHSLLIPCQMILEGVPMTVCSCVRFKEMFSFERNQELESLWYALNTAILPLFKTIFCNFILFLSLLCVLAFFPCCIL